MSHSSPSYKRRAVFVFEAPSSAPAPTFEGILVGRDSQEWWTFDQKDLEQRRRRRRRRKNRSEKILSNRVYKDTKPSLGKKPFID